MADENPPVEEQQKAPEGIDPALADLAREDRFDVADVLAIQARYQKVKEALMQKYPEVAEDLKKSFQTPQIGPFHLEGKTLESHIALILHIIEQLDSGKVDDDIQDPALRQLLVDTIKKHKAEFTEYAFFHDIAKPDCMAATTEEGNHEIEITWEDWLEIQAQGEPYNVEIPELTAEVTGLAYYVGTGNKIRKIAKDLDIDKEGIKHLKEGEGVVLNPTDKLELKDQELFITWAEWEDVKAKGEPYTYVRPAKKMPIKSMRYVQSSRGAEGNHGNAGAKLLEDKLGEGHPSSLILNAMRMHETAFQAFSRNVSAETYEDFYGEFTEEEMATILTSSYVDFAASLKEESDVSSFQPLLNVATARSNSMLIRRYIESCPSELQEKMFPENKFNELRSRNQKLIPKDVEKLRVKLKTYTEEEVRTALSKAKGKTDADVITPDEMSQVVAILATGHPVNLNDAGRVLRAKLGFTMPHLIKIGTDPFVLKAE